MRSSFQDMLLSIRFLFFCTNVNCTIDASIIFHRTFTYIYGVESSHLFHYFGWHLCDTCNSCSNYEGNLYDGSTVHFQGCIHTFHLCPRCRQCLRRHSCRCLPSMWTSRSTIADWAVATGVVEARRLEVEEAQP